MPSNSIINKEVIPKYERGDIVYAKVFIKKVEKLEDEKEPRYYMGSLLGYDEICLPESYILKKDGTVNDYDKDDYYK